ncbi:MAG: alpha-L-glutamate ligase-like protein [Planctomycetes bacterium RBG_16_64_10]|nr:MAG: alpha-L-glutamate ligase-like protein [Planctomycetes bacterium RBG_16_64_10]
MQFRRRLWAWPWELRRRGVLGVNRRNARLLLAENRRAHFPRVDDKLRTKLLCESRGIQIPQTYALIEHQGEIRRFPASLGSRAEFVIKPAKGSAGRGILVIAQHEAPHYVTSSGAALTPDDLRYHLRSILSGLYSLGGQPDRAIIEQRIRPHPFFEHIAVGGTPDIRIILYRGVPVMGMVRLPTRASRGRANLHQGAAGAAVDLNTGQTFGGVWRTRRVSVHPDTGQSIDGLQVPAWDVLIAAAINLAEALELGYLGVDFVLGAEVGPVVLEANARPGLAIQIANQRGLLPRLKLVASQPRQPRHWCRRLELMRMLAGLP